MRFDGVVSSWSPTPRLRTTRSRGRNSVAFTGAWSAGFGGQTLPPFEEVPKKVTKE